MPDRQLPERPNLRFLKLEAKRRLAAGEFSALHEAQATIAHEYGEPSWAALKQSLGESAEPDSAALDQIRWVVARFRDADGPKWSQPDDAEIREHFSPSALAVAPPAQLVAAGAALAPYLRQPLTVLTQTPTSVSAQVADVRLDARVEETPPHRLTDLRAFPGQKRGTDARLAETPPSGQVGAVPAGVLDVAQAEFASAGLAGLTVAGSDASGSSWFLTRGWADLERHEALDIRGWWPTPGVTALATATAVLRLVAQGAFSLDTPADTLLRGMSLEDSAITVRELLSHSSGVANPPPADLYTDRVPDQTALPGNPVESTHPRGVLSPSNGGYAVLGQLIADVTGQPFPEAVTRLVLSPLGLTSASFPATTRDLGPDAVSGYALAPDDTLAPVDARICAVPAVGGLWATAAEILRLATGWSTLLPTALVQEALAPQSQGAGGSDGPSAGLGWLLNPGRHLAVHGGAGGGFTTALLFDIEDERTLIALTNRVTPLDSLCGQLLQAWRTPTA